MSTYYPDLDWSNSKFTEEMNSKKGCPKVKLQNISNQLQEHNT